MNEKTDDIAALDAALQSLANKPVVKKPEWGVQDKDGATITAEDPIALCTPEPTPVPHPPPALPPQLQGAAPRATPRPVEQSALTSKTLEAPPTPVPARPKLTNEKRIFFTGRSGTGKTWLTAKIRELHPDMVVVDGIDSARDFKALQEAGFVHYHVCCSGMTLESRPRRVGVPEILADSLDKNVKLQLVRGGSNHQLHCIWNDTAKMRPSERVLTVAEFLNQY